MRRFLSPIFENWQWKIFSVVAAAMLWMALIDSPELTSTTNVPLEFKNFPASLDFGNAIPDEVQLQIRGPQNAVQSAHEARTAVVLDLGQIQQPGEVTFRVADSISGLPSNVHLVNAVPNQIRLMFERQVRKEVPVRLRINLRGLPGYRFLRSELRPDKVTISGPESRVLEVDDVVTDMLDFGTIEARAEAPVIEARLQAFVEDPRVRIETKPSVRVKVYLERIAD